LPNKAVALIYHSYFGHYSVENGGSLWCLVG